MARGEPYPDGGAIGARSVKRSISWVGNAVMAVDQCAFPDEYRELRLSSVDDVIDAIARLAIRGAPALGAAGALGVALSALAHSGGGRAGDLDVAAVRADAARLVAVRPTAVNLAGAVARVSRRLPDGPAAVLDEALSLLAEDESVNRSAARRAAAVIRRQVTRRPIRILTHCNTGRFATVAWGTALGAIRELAISQDVDHVLVCETRPLLQGSRLTTWELAEEGIPHKLCVDSAGPAAIASGLVDCVVVGADRVTASCDVANKIGTYGLAAAASRAGIPFVVVAPESTMDMSTHDGSDIVIEQRAADEVLLIGHTRVAPAGTPVFNPAFDVTPAGLITTIVTEDRVIEPADAPAGGTAPPSGGLRNDNRRRVASRVAGLTEIVVDFPRQGVEFHDLSALYSDPALVTQMAAAVEGAYSGQFDCVLAVEARGFVLGTAVALRAGRPLVLCRKPGKLPGAVHSVDYSLEYGDGSLQVQRGRIRTGSRVLVVDDLLATGGTLKAAERLVRASAAHLCGHAVVVELAALGGRDALAPSPVYAIRIVEGPA
jgi:S-methyl-5-thioribose-1-phosphate isomerase/adenine phosphoribosyltransferase